MDAQVKTKEEEKAHSQANVQEKQQRLTVLTEAVAGLQAQLRSLDSEIAANHAKAEQVRNGCRAGAFTHGPYSSRVRIDREVSMPRIGLGDAVLTQSLAIASQLDAQARALEAEKATHSNTMESKKSIAGTAAAAAAVAAVWFAGSEEKRAV